MSDLCTESGNPPASWILGRQTSNACRLRLAHMMRNSESRLLNCPLRTRTPFGTQGFDSWGEATYLRHSTYFKLYASDSVEVLG